MYTRVEIPILLLYNGTNNNMMYTLSNISICPLIVTMYLILCLVKKS
jgi:hypothetical protein